MTKSNNGGSRGRSPHYKANNKGGYGNPPVKGQFQPGNRGGPGRRKGVTTLEQALRKMFRSKVAITRNGNPAKIDMMDAMAERAKKEILAGNYKALELGFRLGARYGPAPAIDDSQGFDFADMTPEQRYAFRKFLLTMPGVDMKGFLQVQSEMKQEVEQKKEATRQQRRARSARKRDEAEKSGKQGRGRKDGNMGEAVDA